MVSLAIITVITAREKRGLIVFYSVLFLGFERTDILVKISSACIWDMRPQVTMVKKKRERSNVREDTK